MLGACGSEKGRSNLVHHIGWERAFNRPNPVDKSIGFPQQEFYDQVQNKFKGVPVLTCHDARFIQVGLNRYADQQQPTPETTPRNYATAWELDLNVGLIPSTSLLRFSGERREFYSRTNLLIDQIIDVGARVQFKEGAPLLPFSHATIEDFLIDVDVADNYRVDVGDVR